MSTVLESLRLAKSFGHVQALYDTSFSLEAGEVVGLVGDNGAGKSTLIKVLSGVYARDSGSIIVEGHEQHFRRPADAVDAGISTVYQDLALVDTRDVAANLFLGREFRKGLFVDRKRLRDEATRIIAGMAVKLPSVNVDVGMLSGGQRQAVAIARATLSHAKVIIMDEPTAALGVTESAKVMELARRLADDGAAVLVISHNLREIWEIADRFLVMRLGTLAGTRRRDESSIDEIVKLIVYGEHPADPALG